MSGDKWGSLPYHRHGEGIDLVPGAPEGCIDPGADPRLVLAFDPDALAAYVERHVKAALTEAAERLDEVARTPRMWMQYPEAARIVHSLADLSP